MNFLTPHPCASPFDVDAAFVWSLAQREAPELIFSPAPKAPGVLKCKAKSPTHGAGKGSSRLGGTKKNPPAAASAGELVRANMNTLHTSQIGRKHFRRFDGDSWQDDERPHVQSATCIAYTDDGKICGLPARHLDARRGGFVCDDHKAGQKSLVLQAALPLEGGAL